MEMINSNQNRTSDPHREEMNSAGRIHNDASVRQHGGSALQNDGVDMWIDELDARNRPAQEGIDGNISAGVMMSWLVKQHLPKITIPSFDGSPLDWVNFVTKFHKVVHKQEYLNDTHEASYNFNICVGRLYEL